MKKFFLYLGILPIVVSFFSCKNDSPSSYSGLPAPCYILFYVYSPDYTTYYVNGVRCSYEKEEKIITLSSSGIRSVTYYNGKILLVNSSSGGSLIEYTYMGGSWNKKRELSLDSADGNNTDGDYPQEFALYGGYAYIALQGKWPNNENLVAKVDLSSFSINATLSVGRQPKTVKRRGGYIFVLNQDWLDKSNPSVSVIDPTSDNIIQTIPVGENPSDVSWREGSNYIWTYDSKYYLGNKSSITAIDTTTWGNSTIYFPITLGGVEYNASFGGSLAFADNNKGYILLNNGTAFHLISFLDNPSSPNFTIVDNLKSYLYVGRGSF